MEGDLSGSNSSAQHMCVCVFVCKDVRVSVFQEVYECVCVCEFTFVLLMRTYMCVVKCSHCVHFRVSFILCQDSIVLFYSHCLCGTQLVQILVRLKTLTHKILNSL